jgi:hypothetical protein
LPLNCLLIAFLIPLSYLTIPLSYLIIPLSSNCSECLPYQVLAKAEAEEEAQKEAVRKEAEEEALERMRMSMSSFLKASSMSTDLSATPPTKVLKTRMQLWLAPMMRDDACNSGWLQ